MILKKIAERVYHLDYLIRMEATGNPEEFARKLGISRRSLFNYLEELKKMGVPVGWSSAKGSYYYSIPGQFRFGFSSDYPPGQADLKNQLGAKKVNPGRQEYFY